MTIFKEWTLALNILSGLIHNPAATKRSIKRVHRFLDRLNGKKRVLWFITYGGTFKDTPEGRSVSTLWVRYPSGLQRVTELHDDVRNCCGETGRYEDVGDTSKAYFDRYVRPFITPELAGQAYKVTLLQPYTRSTTELRDHPFTPGVREFYELSTTYSATSDIGGNYAPLSFCRFITKQSTVRVQLRGEQLLLIQDNRVWNISAGRLPQIELSSEVREGIWQLAWELAERKLAPQELSSLNQFAARNDDLCLLLTAIRFPQAIHLQGLLRYLQCADTKVRRIALKHKGGLKPLLRKLFGPLPASATALMNNQMSFAMARLLHESGFQSPDLKLKVIEHHSQNYHPREGDFKWYVDIVGEKTAAMRLCQTTSYEHRSYILNELDDSKRLYETVIAAGQPFKLSGLSIAEIHDQLSRIHRRLQHENLPIPSASNPKLSHLDHDLLCPEFGLLQFRRARQTHELIETGETLHNCVSGYMAQAMTGQAIIVIARDAMNVPKICLEIRKNKLCQYKLDRNERPRTEATITTALSYIQAARLQSATSDVPTNLTPEQLRALQQEAYVGAGQAGAEAVFINEDLPF